MLYYAKVKSYSIDKEAEEIVSQLICACSYSEAADMIDKYWGRELEAIEHLELIGEDVTEIPNDLDIEAIKNLQIW